MKKKNKKEDKKNRVAYVYKTLKLLYITLNKEY